MPAVFSRATRPSSLTLGDSITKSTRTEFSVHAAGYSVVLQSPFSGASAAWRLISWSDTPVTACTFQGCKLPLDATRAAPSLRRQLVDGACARELRFAIRLHRLPTCAEAAHNVSSWHIASY